MRDRIKYVIYRETEVQFFPGIFGINHANIFINGGGREKQNVGAVLSWWCIVLLCSQ